MKALALIVLVGLPLSAAGQLCTSGFQTDTGSVGADEPGSVPVSVPPRVMCGTRWDPDGPGPASESLVVGGFFGGVDGVPSNYVAWWDRREWHALPGIIVGSGSSTDNVVALAVHNGSLYAAGYFGLPGAGGGNRVARWDGTEWVQEGNLLNGPIACMASFAGELWIGGDFTAGPGADFAHLDAGVWTGFPLGSTLAGASNTKVSAMTIHHGELIVGGSFPARIMRWAGALPPLGGFGGSLFCFSGCSGTVQALLSDSDDLYAAGDFTLAPPNTTRPGVMKWNGTEWTAMPLSVGQPGARSLTRVGSDLLLCTAEGSAASSTLRRWNGSAWVEFLTPVLRGSGGALPSFGLIGMVDGRPILGGTFTDIFDTTSSTPRPLRMIAQLDGATIRSVSRGIDARVTAMLPWSDGGTLAVGRFRNAGGQNADRIAIYQADGFWSPFPGGAPSAGFDGEAWCATITGGTLIVGGSFSSAGGVPVSRLARWQGTAWEPMGEITSGYPVALVTAGDETLLATSSSAGRTDAPYVAVYRWDGTQWTILPGSAGSGRLLRAGGDVWLNSSATAPIVLRWTGAAFQPVPLPVGESSLSILGARAGEAYATGTRGIYRWTGAAFELAAALPALPSGTVIGPDTADDGTVMHVPTQNFAGEQIFSWDGFSWATQGSMPLNPGYSTAATSTSLRAPALFARSGDLLVGGGFLYSHPNRARPAAYFARQLDAWRPITIEAPPIEITLQPGDDLTLPWILDRAANTYSWRRNGVALDDGLVPGFGDISGARGAILNIANARGAAGGVYDCLGSLGLCGTITLQRTTVIVRCDADFNADGVVDQDDLAYLVEAIAGGANPTGRDLDFNRDGSGDQDDIALLVGVIAGGTCP